MDTKELVLKYGLDNKDVFKHPKMGFLIVTRAGIEKIQAKENIKVEFEIMHCSEDHKYVVVEARASVGNKNIQTYGEASPENNRMPYPIAMAEKRALSRSVLKIAGLYAHGIFGEDELDEGHVAEVSNKGSDVQAEQAPAVKQKLNAETMNAMLEAIKNGNKDKVFAALSKYEPTALQKSALKKAAADH
jgi:hypothetical protein